MECINDFMGNLNISISGIGRKMLETWHWQVFDNGGKKDSAIKDVYKRQGVNIKSEITKNVSGKIPVFRILFNIPTIFFDVLRGIVGVCVLLTPRNDIIGSSVVIFSTDTLVQVCLLYTSSTSCKRISRSWSDSSQCISDFC